MTTIHVDRTIPIIDGPCQIRSPELERTGPDEYDLATDVELWLPECQDNINPEYNRVDSTYHYLVEHDMLGKCLGLQDAHAIIAQGKDAFIARFGKSGTCILWRTKAELVGPEYEGLSPNQTLCVPFLFWLRDEILISWHSFGKMIGKMEALRFKD